MKSARLLAESNLVIEPQPRLGQLSLRSLIPRTVGSVLASFAESAIMSRPNRYTVQKDHHEHLDLCPEYLRYINHSCSPNVFFDVDRAVVLVIAPIAAGDELTFFYPSTEWEMCEPFECLCRTDACVGWIGGAKHMSPGALAKYRLSAHIRRRVSTHWEQSTI